MKHKIPPACGWILVAACVLWPLVLLPCFWLASIDPSIWVEQYRYSLTPSPTPGYEPMAGLAYMTNRETGGAIELELGPRVGRPGGVFLRHGTQVEILESVWYYEPSLYGNIVCYMYHIRDPKTGVEGWIEEDWLTKDLAEIHDVRCYLTPHPTRTNTRQPLTGHAFITTLGAQKDQVDFWSGPGSLDGSDSNYLFSQPHGMPVDILENQMYVFRTPDDQFILCYNYRVRTEDGLEGWVAGSSLTQDLNQPSGEADCAR